MISLADLTTPVTRQQVEQSTYDVLGVLGVDTTSWKPGAVVRAMITAVALLLSAFSALMAQITAGGFLETAIGAWLTLVAKYVYGVDRVEASFASGFLTLTNSGGGVFADAAYDRTFRNPTTGKTYQNSTSFSLGAGSSVTIAIVATEAGAASTSLAGTITEIQTTMLGVTCANAAALVGQDAELDPVLRARCYEKLGALSPNGPWDAYAFAAKNARRANGTSIGVTRVRVAPPDGFGNVTTYVATASGGVSGISGDPSTDLGSIHAAILHQAAPLAVTAHTQSAAPFPISPVYQAWLYNTSGLTEQQIKDAVAAKITAYLSTQAIGGNLISGVGYVYADALRTVIGSALPQIFHVVLASPAGDTSLSIDQVPTLGTITPTITQVPPPDGGL